LLTITTAGALADPADASTTAIKWRACHQTFYCARVHVPLDYGDPDGPQITLSLAKQPATDPQHRIGSLFINPGGPGGSGVDFLLGAGAELFTPQVRARFDIIGFDPRGIERSTPLKCFATDADAEQALAPFPYPNSAARRAEWIQSDRTVEAACAQSGTAILDHMSTADAARDLDRLRQLVGDPGLTYYGVSYGSMLGNVYANLFPARVRSVVIDGVLDPIAWTTGTPGTAALPFSTRLRSAHGSMVTLDEFFRLCDAAGPSCALAPNSEQKYFQLYNSLKAHPIDVGNPLPYDESFLVGDTLGAMYDSPDWADFATFLADLRAAAPPAVLAADRAGFARYDNFVEGFDGVACSDSVNPQSPSAWTKAAAQSRQEDGLFGPLWTWVSSVCAHWPGQDSDRYLGPFTHYTKDPVLVVGNLSDPATPYEGAQHAAQLLPNSRLLTVHGWGHTSLFLSQCATNKIATYLLTSHVPAAGTVCQQDVVPFTTPAAQARVRAQKPVARGPVW
jgi:pimeloyl-ACP methyl ester carboxylesterase